MVGRKQEEDLQVCIVVQIPHLQLAVASANVDDINNNWLVGTNIRLSTTAKIIVVTASM